MSEKSEIIKLGDLAKDSDQLQEIGKSIVKQAAENALAERLGLPIKSPMVARRVLPGSTVPADLLNQSGVIFDPTSKIAETGWEKTWLNLGVWDRNWGQNENDRIIGRPIDLANRFQLSRVLTDDEINVVERLKLRDV
ncbi:hypothetical protein [Lentzea sp. NPDC092896]|uniref:hypothetical protein n=1 Tax=Lentzea sp. NPDC092896 TaxID=3364127 RepID=UPI0037F7C3CF